MTAGGSFAPPPQPQMPQLQPQRPGFAPVAPPRPGGPPAFGAAPPPPQQQQQQPAPTAFGSYAPPPPPAPGGGGFVGGVPPPPPQMQQMPPQQPGFHQYPGQQQQQQPQQMMQPPPPPPVGGMGGVYGGGNAANAPAANATGHMEAFEALFLGGGPGPGGIGGGGDPSTFPRPAGEAAATAAQPPPNTALPGSCEPRFMRMTVNAVPAQQAIRQRFQLPIGAIVHPLAPRDGAVIGGEGLGFGASTSNSTSVDQNDDGVPVVPLTAAGIVRCRRCRTYINPFVQWVDGGRRFVCNVCALANEVPVEYYAPLDAEGKRMDAPGSRPELTQGSVEYVAPAEYMVRAPMPPSYLFVIDVSAPACASGAVAAVARGIKACLDDLPGAADARAQVGVVTFDSALHFYSLKPGQSQPQMVVVPEVADPFVPCLPEDLLVNLSESRAQVDQLLDALPAMFSPSSAAAMAASGVPAQHQQGQQNAPGGAPGASAAATGAALQAAYMAMAHCGGKLLLFATSCPSLGAGKLRPRDPTASWGTDAEHRLRGPEDPFFKKFAAEASRAQVAVDVFSFARGPTDLASLAALPKYTCGQLYYYPGFHAPDPARPSRDARRLAAELRRNLTRPTGWEAVMRIRCSRGLRISAFHGHFFVRSTDLLALPQVDPDKAFAVQVAHEDAVVQGGAAFIQCALLYTASGGERRIRVHTLALPVVQDLADLYRAVDGGATAALLAKLAVEKAYGARLDETRAAIQHKVGLALREYRLAHASSSAGGYGGQQPQYNQNYGAPRPVAAVLPHNALVFPPGLRHLAVWTLGITKLPALRGGARDVSPDERAAQGLDVMAAPVRSLLRLLYPAMLPVHDPSGDWGRPRNGPKNEPLPALLPSPAPLALEALDPAGAYLLDAGRVLVLWLGRAIRPDLMGALFGPEAVAASAASASGTGVDALALDPEPARQGSELSSRVCAVLASLRATRPNFPPCFVVRQGSPAEAHVLPYFVEDRGPGTPSYADFAASLQKTVLAKA